MKNYTKPQSYANAAQVNAASRTAGKALANGFAKGLLAGRQDISAVSTHPLTPVQKMAS